MNITKQLFLFVLALVCGLCQAQDELPTISADRPGALTGTDVMPRYKIQWETGIGYESMASGPRCFTLNSTLLRFGPRFVWERISCCSTKPRPWNLCLA